MKAVLIGMEHIKGKNKKTNNDYEFYVLHVVYEKSKTLGQATAQVSCNPEVIQDELNIGDELEFVYQVDFNGYTKLIGICRA